MYAGSFGCQEGETAVRALVLVFLGHKKRRYPSKGDSSCFYAEQFLVQLDSFKQIAQTGSDAL